MSQIIAPSGIITLLTDFGYVDPYIGAMKGVILSICNRCSIVDISHDIAPQDVWSAAFVIHRAYGYFPKGTVHVAVVDPGVGGQRKAIVVQTHNFYFVGPDNGIFTLIYREEGWFRIRELLNPTFHLPSVSSTFHGRDIFSPVAAHLVMGVPFEEFGPILNEWEELHIPEPRSGPGSVEGEVVYIDRFGNCITNIREEELNSWAPGQETLEIRAGRGLIVGLKKSYQDVPKGKPLALIGSSGFLEISVNLGNASSLLGLKRGSVVSVRRRIPENGE